MLEIFDFLNFLGVGNIFLLIFFIVDVLYEVFLQLFCDVVQNNIVFYCVCLVNDMC